MFSGTVGVEIFFVLSGFLITSLLLAEKDLKQKINFKNFYIRRFLRLSPPFFIFIISTGLLMNFGFIRESFEGLVYSIFYLYNFVPYKYSTGELSHTWSLALEEQYYLIWPLIIYYLSKKRSLITLIISLLFLCIIATYELPKIEFTVRNTPQRWFIPAVAPILVGSLFAILNAYYKVWITAIFKNKFLPFILIVGLFILPIFVSNSIYKISYLFQSISIGILLLWLIHNQKTLIVKLLEFKPLVYIGKISYGLYIYQGIFLTTGPLGKLWMQQYPQNIIFTIIISIVSYYFLEKPILLLKKRFK